MPPALDSLVALEGKMNAHAKNSGKKVSDLHLCVLVVRRNTGPQNMERE